MKKIGFLTLFFFKITKNTTEVLYYAAPRSFYSIMQGFLGLLGQKNIILSVKHLWGSLDSWYIWILNDSAPFCRKTKKTKAKKQCGKVVIGDKIARDKNDAENGKIVAKACKNVAR